MRTSLILLTLLFSLPAFANWHSDNQDIMGTRVSVTLWAEDDAKGKAAVAAVMDEMRRIDAEFRPYL